MHIPLIKSRALAVVAGALVTSIGVHVAECQGKPQQLRAAVDLRIDKDLPRNARSMILLVGPSGDIYAAAIPSPGGLRSFDSTGRAASWSIKTGYGDDLDIRAISRLGWFGNTLWVADPGFGQIALVDRNGKVTKSLEYPSWVRPSWSDRRKYPVFARLEPVAVYAEGSWLVRPSQQRSVMSTPEYDDAYNYFMRIGENGTIQRVVARFPRDRDRVEYKNGNSTRSIPSPFPPLTVWDVSSDGARIAVVTTALRGADSASYRVTMIGEKGDTIYSRKFPFTPAPLTKQGVDSIRARLNRGMGGRAPDEAIESVLKQLPAAHPAVESVVIGRDKTLWLELHSTGADRQWVMLDAAGAPASTVSLPKTFVLRAADRDHVWGYEVDGDHVGAVVRYKVKK